MPISFKSLHQHFAAEVRDFDMRQPIDATGAITKVDVGDNADDFAGHGSGGAPVYDGRWCRQQLQTAGMKRIPRLDGRDSQTCWPGS